MGTIATDVKLQAAENPFDTVDTVQEEKIDKMLEMENHISKKTITNVPSIMQLCKLWLWTEPKNKAPVSREGYNVNGYDAKNCTTFDDMINDNPNNFYYNFSLQNNFLVIDLDGCVKSDGTLHDFASDVINEIKDLNPYIEYSMSRKGIHVIFESTKSFNNIQGLNVKMKKVHAKYSHLDSKSGIEFFNNNHCITLTGDIYESYNPNTLGKTNNQVKVLYNRIKELQKVNHEISKQNMRKKEQNGTTDISDVFEIIKQTVSIEQLLEEYKVEIRGSTITCPLPGHNDKTPSFHVYHADNQWHCFGCKCGKSVIDFVMFMDKISGIEACKKLDKMFNLNLDFKTHASNIDENWIIIGDDNKIYIDITILRDHLSYDHNIIYTEQSILIYENGVYKNIEPFEVKLLIESHMPTTYNNKYKKSTYVDEAYLQLKRHFKNYTDFNVDQYSVNFKNCNVKFDDHGKMKINEHSSDNLFTFQAAGEYNKEADCKYWNKFMDETLPKDQQKLVQEMMGYALIKNNRAKKFFGFYGAGDTGKSVILTTLVKMIGIDYTSAVPLQRFTDKNSRFDTSALMGKRANICGDIPSTPLEDTSCIKQLVGDDIMSFEYKHKNAIHDFNYARLYFSMNKMPASYDKSQEFFNRFIIVPFLNVCDHIDTELPNKFDIEAVLNWSMKGLQRLIKNNLEFSTTAINDSLIKHYIQMDSPVVEFISEYCEVTNDKSDVIFQNDLMKYFKYYCKEIINSQFSSNMKTNNLVEDITTRYQQVSFSKNLVNRVTGTKNARGLKGIKVTKDFMKEYEHFINKFH